MAYSSPYNYGKNQLPDGSTDDEEGKQQTQQPGEVQQAPQDAGAPTAQNPGPYMQKEAQRPALQTDQGTSSKQPAAPPQTFAQMQESGLARPPMPASSGFMASMMPSGGVGGASTVPTGQVAPAAALPQAGKPLSQMTEDEKYLYWLGQAHGGSGLSGAGTSFQGQVSGTPGHPTDAAQQAAASQSIYAANQPQINALTQGVQGAQAAQLASDDAATAATNAAAQAADRQRWESVLPGYYDSAFPNAQLTPTATPQIPSPVAPPLAKVGGMDLSGAGPSMTPQDRTLPRVPGPDVTGTLPPQTGTGGSVGGGAGGTANPNAPSGTFDLLGALTGGAAGTGAGSDIQKATQAAFLKYLQNPNPYGAQDVKDQYNYLAGNIDDQYSLDQQKLGEEMARRGLGSSTIYGGRLQDLNIGKRSAKEALATDLAHNFAQNYGSSQQGALGLGNTLGTSAQNNQQSWLQQLMGYGQQAFNNDLATNAQNQSASQAYQNWILQLLGLGYS